MTSGTTTLVFDTGVARSGPLSRGQDNIMRSLLRGAGHVALDTVLSLPCGTDLEGVVDALRILVERHEALRTTYLAQPGGIQTVACHGALDVGVHEVGEQPPAELIRSVSAALWAKPFDPEKEFAVRAAVITRQHRPTSLVLVVSHLAVDGFGFAHLTEELRALLDGERPAGTVTHPLDVVEVEQRPQMRQLMRASNAYWEDHLMRAPHSGFPAGVVGEHGSMQPSVVLRSSRAAEAAGSVSRRLHVSRATVVLAAFASLVSGLTDQPGLVVSAPTANRFLPELRGYLGTLASDALILLDVAVSDSFDGLCAQAAARAMRAYSRAWYDTAALYDSIAETSRLRGINAYARECLFNDVSALGGAVLPAASADPFTDGVEPSADAYSLSLLTLNLHQLDGVLVASVNANPHCLPGIGPGGFARALEQLLVRAGASDIDHGTMSRILPAPPVRRTGDWHYIDHGWIHLGAVRRMLAAELGRYQFEVEVVPDGAREKRLVCHVHDRSGELSATRLHCKLVEAVHRHAAVMAPHEYVFHDGRKPLPEDDPGRRRRPVRESGR